MYKIDDPNWGMRLGENEKDTGIVKTFSKFLCWYDKYCGNEYADIIHYLLQARCNIANGGPYACAL